MRRLLCALLLAALPLTTSAQSPATRASLTATTCPGVGCVTLGVSGLAHVAIQITGTFTGTVTFEASIDGITYVALNMTPPNSVTPATTATAAGLWTGNVGGLAIVRARCSAYTDGTIVVSIQAAP